MNESNAERHTLHEMRLCIQYFSSFVCLRFSEREHLLLEYVFLFLYCKCK